MLYHNSLRPGFQVHSHDDGVPSQARAHPPRPLSHLLGLRIAEAPSFNALEAVSTCPRDRLVALCNSAIETDPHNVIALFTVYREEADPDRKIDLFRALRVSLANNPGAFQGTDAELVAPLGFRDALSIHALPTGPRQGAGLLTNFHLVSQLCLRSLPEVQFLPLPEKFPKIFSVSPDSVCDYPGSHTEVFDPKDFAEVAFGRSRRFETRDEATCRKSPLQTALKAERRGSEDALALIRYEAALMTYLQRYRDYFGLESEIPFPSRGPGNRVAAWGFDDVHHLLYSALPSYFRYLDELRDPDQICEAAGRAVRDLMRLARFGIFHTELAPIFHSVEQKRTFIWNVGGLLPGAGDLEYWKESFTHANLRQSGIADYEHLQRWARMSPTVEIVNDTSRGADLGLQFHLGNIVFCTLHVMALAFQRAGYTLGDRPHAASTLLHQAFEAFTGRPWTRYVNDVDEALVTAELSAIGHGKHIGEFSGAYPHQNVLKAITAFTLRAIPEFVESRRVQRTSLPAPVPKHAPAPDLITSRPRFAKEIISTLAALEASALMQQIEELGLTPEERLQLVGNILLGQVRRARVRNSESAPFLVVHALGTLQALQQTVGDARATGIASALLFHHPHHSGAKISLLELSKIPDCWLVAGEVSDSEDQRAV